MATKVAFDAVLIIQIWNLFFFPFLVVTAKKHGVVFTLAPSLNDRGLNILAQNYSTLAYCSTVVLVTIQYGPQAARVPSCFLHCAYLL